MIEIDGVEPGLGRTSIGERHLSLRDQVLTELRRRIVDAEYLPGERLTEDRLAADFGVSRNPVREALRVVEAEGFVEVQPRRGAVVATPDERTIARHVRRARACSSRWPPGSPPTAPPTPTWPGCGGCSSQARGATDEGDFVRVAELNSDLHHAVVRMSGNRWLEQFSGAMYRHVHWVFRLGRPDARGALVAGARAPGGGVGGARRGRRRAGGLRPRPGGTDRRHPDLAASPPRLDRRPPRSVRLSGRRRSPASPRGFAPAASRPGRRVAGDGAEPAELHGPDAVTSWPRAASASRTSSPSRSSTTRPAGVGLARVERAREATWCATRGRRSRPAGRAADQVAAAGRAAATGPAGRRRGCRTRDRLPVAQHQGRHSVVRGRRPGASDDGSPSSSQNICSRLPRRKPERGDGRRALQPAAARGRRDHVAPAVDHVDVAGVAAGHARPAPRSARPAPVAGSVGTAGAWPARAPGSRGWRAVGRARTQLGRRVLADSAARAAVYAGESSAASGDVGGVAVPGLAVGERRA